MDNELKRLTKQINRWNKHRERAIRVTVDGTAPLRRMRTGSGDVGEAFARAFYEWNLRDDKKAAVWL